ncbi:Peptidyl-prolyl cis-trans isomerase [Mycena venus]|uniref:Peptidyl-prolyl cis-trans isomerase n=1 Tax=Mycena venus TaxID=2733690 RepID=A0A8H6X3N9_9AGAR|nr:Peptidyl-prolyl cis-trans isomerase [Mycena venus]
MDHIRSAVAASPLTMIIDLLTIDRLFTSTIMSNCYFKINIDDKPAGRIVFNLFDDVVPKATVTFRKLCRGQDLDGAPSSEWHTYAGSKFHHIIPNVTLENGDNGVVLICDLKGADKEKGAGEEQHGRHPHRTPVFPFGMAIPNKNGSQFFATPMVTSWLDGKHVVFGEVVEGADLVKQIEALGSDSGEPSKTVSIAASGCIE